MKNTFSISFFVRNNRKDAKDKVPIFMRITVNGKRTELSASRKINPQKWNKAGKAIGTKQEIRELNTYMDSLKSRVYEIHRNLIDRKELVTPDRIKQELLGNSKTSKTLIEVFTYHNQIVHELIGKDYALGTYQRYATTLDHVKDFLKYQYKSDDVFLHELNYEFVANLEYYFKKVRNCNNNSTLKYIRNLKKIVLLAIKNEWLEKDPFVRYQGHLQEVKREFLTMEELKVLENKEIGFVRLEVIRDLFVFACYTGLAYADIANLTKSHVVLGIDGEKWIYTYRQKTDIKSNIPLMPIANSIIEKYQDNPLAENRGKLFPVPSNQKTNAYLKELADICGIKKNLTFHLARHTFATTVTLTNGVPIESVSKMLGHTNIKTTQIYAKVVEKKVSEDMSKLKKILSS